MNRPGKKSSLTKAAHKSKHGAKKRSQPKSQRDREAKKSVKSKKRSSNKALGDRNPRLKQSLKQSLKQDLAAANGDAHRRKKVNAVEEKKPQKPLKIAIYAIAITVGLSTIFGSLVSMASSFQAAEPQPDKPAKVRVNSENKAKLDSLFAIASLGKEIAPLRSSLEQLADRYPDLEPEVFFVDLDSRGFVNLGSKKPIASASTIKLPILVAFFQDVDLGKISLKEQLVMTKDLIAGGSGNMQYEKPGTKFSALEVAERMMTISDNTATNMLIQRMGGKSQLNQRFEKMGLTATMLRNPLPDLTGTNTTTAADLGNLLVKLDRGNLISLRSRDRLLYIMRNIVKDTLLPQGLESGAIIAHKTGDIKSVLGDAGIIDLPNGKRYIASVLVKRPDNSSQAKEFIQKASRTAYQYFKEPRSSSFTLEEKE